MEKSLCEALWGSHVEFLTLNNLPTAEITRRELRPRALVAYAIHAGLLSREEACVRYGISDTELASWQRLLEEQVLSALRATITQP